MDKNNDRKEEYFVKIKNKIKYVINTSYNLLEIYDKYLIIKNIMTLFKKDEECNLSSLILPRMCLVSLVFQCNEELYTLQFLLYEYLESEPIILDKNYIKNEFTEKIFLYLHQTLDCEDKFTIRNFDIPLDEF